MCYNLLGAMLPCRWQTYNPTYQPFVIYSEIPQKNINLLLFTFGDFYYEKIHRRSTKIPCYSCEFPTLAWAKYIGVAGEEAAARKSLCHWASGIHFWHLGEAHASWLDSHFHALPSVPQALDFSFPSTSVWHWVSSQTSEPRHLHQLLKMRCKRTCSLNKNIAGLMLLKAQ